MFMGLGMPIPDLSNKPGPGRPGYPTGAFEFKLQIEGTGTFTFTGSKAGGGQNFSIDWGDGTSASGLTGTSHTHTYSTAGPHILMINNEEDSGPINVFQITAGETLVTKVLNWGTTAWNNLTAAFSGCTNLTTLEDSALTTDSNGDMYDCFNGCTGLTTVNGKKWNLSAGARIGRWFNGCTNLELLDLTGVSINLIEASDDAFQSSGSATTNGCEFKLSGVTLTQSSSLSHDDWFKSTKLKPTSTFANITWPSTRFNAISWFYEAVMTGTNSVLDCSGWTTFKGELSYWFSRFNNVGGGVSPSNTNQKINLTNFSGDLLTGGLTEFMANSAVSRIIGLSTWGATSGTPISFSRAFLGARVFAIDASDNFSNTFMSSAVVNDMTGFYANVGDDYNGTPVSGAAPNLTGLDVSNATSFSQAFVSTRLTSNIDFNNIIYGSAAYNFGQAFQAYYGHTYAGSHIDFSNATLKISSLSSAFFSYGSELLEKVTFGNNVDFSQMTSFSHAFYRLGTGGATSVELPTNADYSAVTNTTSMFFNTPVLSTCQVDYFIRNLYSSRQSLGAGGALTINMPGMSITEAPSVVRSTLDDLVALGYNIGLGAADATLPFAYSSYAVDPTGITTISPTVTPPAGSVFTATNGLSISASGVITIGTFRGGSTIRCTYPDGCYNEVVMLIQVPFVMRTVIPGLVGSTTYLDMEVKPQMSAGECFVDWGDSNSETLTGNTTHTYASAGTYDIKIFDSPSGSKFENFSGYFPTYAGINSATYGSTYDIDIIQWGEIQWKNPSVSGQGWFSISANQKSYIELAAASNDAPDLSQATSLRKMFGTSGGGAGQSDIARFTDPNDSMRSWNTSTITDMSEMWKAKLTDSSLSLDLSQWDVSNVETFASMFDSGSGNQQSSIGDLDISGWDTQRATNMSRMFYRTSANSVTGLGDLNTSLVTTMSQMFNNASSGVVGQAGETFATKMVSGTLRWDVNNVVSFNNMFQDAEQLSNANFPTNWNITSDASKTVSMSTMFGGTPSGLTGVTNLDAFATKTINETWYGGTSYTSWNMSRVSSLNQFAYSAGGGPISRNYNIASWQISSVLTDMFYMFGGKSGGNGSIWQQDVGHWDVSGLDDGPSKISYWLSARNGNSPPNMGTTIYDSILDVTDGWGSQTGTAGFPTTITMQNGTSKYTPGISIEGTTNNTGTSTTIYDSTKNFTNEGNAGNIAVGDILYNKDTLQYSKVLSFGTYTVVTDQSIWGSSGINYRVENSNAARGKIALINAGWFVNDGGAYIPPVTPLQLQFTVASNTQTQIDIPYVQGTSFTVDWGDGLTETSTGSNNRTLSHTYNDGNNNNVTNPTVSINAQGDLNPLTGFSFGQSGGGSKALLIDIPAWGNTPFTYVQSLLSGCNNLNTLSATDAPIITTSNFYNMLGSTGTLGNADLTSWDVSSATYTGYMFAGSLFNGNISNWDVSNVTNMSYMFNGAAFSGNISSWDVRNVTDAGRQFIGMSGNPDITGWFYESLTTAYFWAWSASNFNPGPFKIGATATNQNWKYMHNGTSWSTNNWTDFLVLNANAANARNPKTPTSALLAPGTNGKTFDTTRTYNTGFPNGGRAFSFLTADVTISGGSSAINGVYAYNYTTQKWVKDGDSEKTIEWNAEESVWEVLSAGVSQHVGSGGTQGNGPESSTSWTGGITVVDSSMGWSISNSLIT
jgi:surface protein